MSAGRTSAKSICAAAAAARQAVQSGPDDTAFGSEASNSGSVGTSENSRSRVTPPVASGSPSEKERAEASVAQRRRVPLHVDPMHKHGVHAARGERGLAGLEPIDAELRGRVDAQQLQPQQCREIDPDRIGRGDAQARTGRQRAERDPAEHRARRAASEDRDKSRCVEPRPSSVVVFTIPDGGLPATSASQCAGHCNGKRACAYAGNETTCGAAFCGDTAEQGVATCDGAGHCLYGVEECSAYACPNGSPGCKTSCAATSDCLATFYCDGATQICKPKLANGTACTNVTQCESGVCDPTAGVCCNIDCASTPGGTCAKAGAVGTCTCGACSGAGGCALFYVDRDGDSYGDMNGTIANGGAAYGCALAADGPPPTGFVADHTDCFDSTVAIANSVHPGQTVFFASAYTNGSGQSSFDYDCSGSTESETVDNAKCGVCSGLRIVTPGGPATTPVLECIFQTTCSSAAEATGHSCSPSPAACTANNNPAYPGTVACGASAESYTCSTCGDAGATSTLSIDAGMRTQRCH